MLGIGAFWACVNLMRYLEYYKRFYTLLSTIRFAFGRVVAFIASAFPVFAGTFDVSCRCE